MSYKVSKFSQSWFKLKKILAKMQKFSIKSKRCILLLLKISYVSSKSLN